MKVRSNIHGAVSIVNAIATGKGCALGISLKVTAEVEQSSGSGISFLTGKKDDLLINNIIRNTLPQKIIDNYKISVKVDSDIPIGFGLKSSSAVSNAVALACSRIAGEVDDFAVLDAAVRASLDAKVTITGAYDDATACYFGGFVVTDNYARKLLRQEPAPENLHAVIFLPRNTPRGDVAKLRGFADLFEDAFGLAQSGDYWKAMKLNGVLACAALSSDYRPVMAAMEAGALGASISGNGPSVAAVVQEDKLPQVQSALSRLAGRVLVSKVNNEKASVEVLE
jgi:shikimate kinase